MVLQDQQVVRVVQDLLVQQELQVLQEHQVLMVTLVELLLDINLVQTQLNQILVLDF